MTRNQGSGLAVVALAGALAAAPVVARAGDHEKEHEKDHEREKQVSSPFIVGVWKFIPPPNVQPPTTQPPSVDSEIRFINPTTRDLTLEYAFFNPDGSFCGCDRDDFPHNKTTEYSMLDEFNLGAGPAGPLVFSCWRSDQNAGPSQSGALKAIVFKHDGQKIILDEASQVGFQTHVFGNVMENGAILTGTNMTESAMVPVPINDETRKEIQEIHDQCVTVNGPL
jgi:hypothetical protein